MPVFRIQGAVRAPERGAPPRAQPTQRRERPVNGQRGHVPARHARRPVGARGVGPDCGREEDHRPCTETAPVRPEVPSGTPS